MTYDIQAGAVPGTLSQARIYELSSAGPRRHIGTVRAFTVAGALRRATRLIGRHEEDLALRADATALTGGPARRALRIS